MPVVNVSFAENTSTVNLLYVKMAEFLSQYTNTFFLSEATLSELINTNELFDFYGNDNSVHKISEFNLVLYFTLFIKTQPKLF